MRSKDILALMRQAHSASAPTFIDVFAGCGGLTLGLMRAGWRGMFAVEKDAFAFATLEANFLQPTSVFKFDWPSWLPRQASDIRVLLETHAGELSKLRGAIDLLAGGPPCQGFSSAGRRKPHDPRNQLFRDYVALVEMVQPRLILLENVEGITYPFGETEATSKQAKPAADDKRESYAEAIERALEERYHVFTSIVRCSDHGIPQSRPRFILIGYSKEFFETENIQQPFAMLEACKEALLAKKGLKCCTTARQAISDLEISRNGLIEGDGAPRFKSIGYKGPLSNYQKAMRDGHSGIPSDTRLARHRPDIARRFARIIAAMKKRNRLGIQLNAEQRREFGVGKSTLRVLNPDTPAPTITSLPDDLLHYSEPRTLTVRENARLQTFPDWFVFKGKYTTGGDRRAREVPRFTQVANAVPPLLAELFGAVLKATLVSSRLKTCPPRSEAA
ncbi:MULTISPECIES: DNA cytosine methyltransferase [unclassified Bradyrhizobium]|uniref:DNA cytosine methyltransferase n=1 Tax=unclassified Bradyrhizobium TaxID=2631580 RepID=UPI00291649E3|nr:MULTISPECIES: DNA cytosine methyltransferase [unclassified Bradyrhizobium]